MKKDQIISILESNDLFHEWYSYVKDIIASDEFQIRKLYPHHDDSVFHHCVLVSFQSFLIARKIHADHRACAIAGLLHDFYPKAWQYNEELAKISSNRIRGKSNLFHMHGFVHAKEAAKNAQKYFPDVCNSTVLDAISHHMFPLTVIPPHHIEGWIVTTTDKLVSVQTLDVKMIPRLIGLGGVLDRFNMGERLL